mmetsp:Transcript_35923/g.111216  ORF Transcript_35923/g.111216 Transcript_35923/m.111216 type:complete len:268 (+) Transcript_35923:90-893(+)
MRVATRKTKNQALGTSLTWANVALYIVVYGQWGYRFGGGAVGALYAVGACILAIEYATLATKLIVYKRIHAIMGIPAFAILYVPPFLCFQYVVFKTDFGATLAASLPWWELILASMYRVPMELPLQYLIAAGDMTQAFAWVTETVEPYRITLFGVKTLTFTRGLSIDGLVALVLGNALLLMSTHKTLTPDVLLGYFVLIQCTLVQQFKILLVTTPGSKLYMLEEDGPTTPSAWRFSRTLPSAIQIYFSSQLGWVVFGLAMRKLPPLF